MLKILQGSEFLLYEQKRSRPGEVVFRVFLGFRQSDYGCGMDPWSLHIIPGWTLSCFGHGCSGHVLQFQHGFYYGLGMDAPDTPDTVCNLDMV